MTAPTPSSPTPLAPPAARPAPSPIVTATCPGNDHQPGRNSDVSRHWSNRPRRRSRRAAARRTGPQRPGTGARPLPGGQPADGDRGRRRRSRRPRKRVESGCGRRGHLLDAGRKRDRADQDDDRRRPGRGGAEDRPALLRRRAPAAAGRQPHGGPARPRAFASSAFGWRDSIRAGKVVDPTGDGVLAVTDPEDIARAAVAALTED